MPTSDDVPGGPIDPDVVAARDLLAASVATSPLPSAERLAVVIGEALVLLNRAIDTPAA